MSNVKKTVKIKEIALVNLIEKIVNEAVGVKKQEWINEQRKKDANKSNLLENKVAELEKKINEILRKK